MMKYLRTFQTTVNKGFTLVELLVSLTILAVLTAIALPNMNEYLIKTRVDNEISALHRLLLTARNTAVNSGKNVTICPLSVFNVCTDNWEDEISVFTNTTNNTTFTSASEQIIKVKAKLSTGDSLKFNQASIVYSATGALVGGVNSEFIYCPAEDTDLARGINISLSGRIYASQDTDDDGKDEDRTGSEFSCS